MGFHRNQQTLSLIPWGVPKSETLKSHHRRRGCVLGQGATKKSKKGTEKKVRVPTRRGRSGDDSPSTISIQKQIGIVGISLGAPEGNGRLRPGVTWWDSRNILHPDWCVHWILRSSQRGSIGSERKNSTPPSFLGLFHSLSWFRSDSRADHVAAGYCSWRKKQKRKRISTRFVDKQTDGLNERRTVGSLGSERDRDGE